MSERAKQIHLGKYQAGNHTVSSTGNGLICDCDFKGDCEHILSVLESLRKAEFGLGFKIMERSKLKLCKYCNSGSIVKRGTRKNKSGKSQLFKCNDCKRTFTANFGFEKKQYDDGIITSALQMYFSKMSVRRISELFEMQGIKIDASTIYRWVDQYSKMASIYLNGITPHVGDWFRADEVWVKINGKQNYLFASMDDDTRFWLASDIANTKFKHNADNLLYLTKSQAGKSPRIFITDGLPAYMKSSRKVFGRNTEHKRKIHLKGKRDRDNNNKMERLNGEIRDREQNFRGLKRMDTAILEGMKVYYNFTKKHSALDGRTPAEASKIHVEGLNKWKTIIQNASLNRATQ